MRAIFFLIIFCGILLATLGFPQLGVLGWTWLTLMNPHRLTYGLSETLPLNLILSLVTFAAWIFSREPKRLPANAAIVLWFCFIAWITFTTILALAPDLAWERWDQIVKIMCLGLLVPAIMTNQVRIHALLWVVVLSLSFFGVKGGGFTILTGGGSHVVGPDSTGLGDNNNLALALDMTLPLMNYLRIQSRVRWVRLGIVGAMLLSAIGVLGTYSRGGLIGLAIMSAYLWWQSKQKIALAIVGVVVVVLAITLLPHEWLERMHSIETADQDSSFMGRVQSWRFAVNVATARPLSGAGFAGTEVPWIYNKYSGRSDVTFANGLAAHSIYFQVLGDHGFVGLALYLLLCITGWRYASSIRRMARGDPSLSWTMDLATMMQVSMVTFFVGGAGLSLAYYDMIYLMLGIVIAVRESVLKQLKAAHAGPRAPFKHTRIAADTGPAQPALGAPKRSPLAQSPR